MVVGKNCIKFLIKEKRNKNFKSNTKVYDSILPQFILITIFNNQLPAISQSDEVVVALK